MSIYSVSVSRLVPSSFPTALGSEVARGVVWGLSGCTTTTDEGVASIGVRLASIALGVKSVASEGRANERIEAIDGTAICPKALFDREKSEGCVPGRLQLSENLSGGNSSVKPVDNILGSLSGP